MSHDVSPSLRRSRCVETALQGRLWVCCVAYQAAAEPAMMITVILCIVCALALPGDGMALDQNGVAPEQPTTLTYDYASLRNWGLILAAVFFLAGLLVLFGKHCKCNFAKDKGQPEEEVMQRRMSMRQAAVSAEV
uniref:phospholemman-like isoform X5 n=1 Tax=Myxine glutinosa TaxID=7769 RepID=UPI00358ED38A